MANVGTAYVSVVPTMKGAASTITKQLGGVNVKGVGDKLGGQLTDGIAKGANGMSGKMAALGGVIGGVAASITSSLISAVSSLGSEMVAASDSAQKFASTLEFAGIDDSTIKQLTASTQEYADRTVYDLADIRNATAQLASNGVDNYAQLAEAAGNLNAVAGGSAETFKSVSMVMSQTAGSGRLMTENWNQLTDAIPGASGALQQAMKDAGAFEGNFRDAMEKGEISAEEFFDAVQKLGMTDVAKEAATSTKTIEGAMGNLQAAVVGVGSQAIDAFKPFITGTISAAANGVQSFGDALGVAIDYAQNWSSISSELSNELGTAATSGDMVSTMLMEMGQAFGISAADSESFRNAVAGAVDYAAGMAESAVTRIKGSLSGISDSFQSAFGGASGKIGEFLSGIEFSSVVSKLAPMGAAIASVAAGFAVFGPAASKAVGAVSAIAPKVSSLIGVLKGIPSTAALVGESLMSVFKAWPPAGILGTIKGIGTLFSGIVSPVTLVIGAIAALAAGFAYMMATNEEFRNTVMQLVGQLGASLAPIITTVATQVAALASTVLPLIMSAIQTVLPVLGQIGLLVLQVVTALAPLVTMLVSTLLPIISQIIQVVVTLATTVISAVMPVISTIVAAISTYMPVIQQVVTSVMTAVLSIVNAVWPAIQAVITTVAGIIQTVVTTAMNVIQGIITAVMQVINGDWSGAWSTIQNTLSGAWDAISSAVESGIQAVIDFFSGLGDRIMGAISGIGSMLYSAGSDLINGLSQGIQDAIGGVVDAVSAGVDSVVSAAKGLLGIASPSKVFAEIGDYTMQGFAQGIEKAQGLAANAMRSAMGEVYGVGSSIKSPVMAGRITGISEDRPTVTQYITNRIVRTNDDLYSAAEIINRSALSNAMGVM